MKMEHLKCFVSAPASSDTSILRAILREKSVETYDAYDFKIGDSFHDTVKQRIRESDFVIIVITETNPNVFYEMGISEGMGKPIFVILGKDVMSPHFAHNYMHVTTPFEDSDLLRMSLLRFVDELVSKKRRYRKKVPQLKSVGRRDALQMLLGRVCNLRSRGKPREIEQVAQQIFSELGLHYVFSESNIRDKGVDFAIWNDSLSWSLGNPLFIEIKSGSLTPEHIYRTERQLQNYLIKSDAKAAILLYLDKKGRRFRENYSFHPLILRYDFEDFVRELSQNSFEDIVLNQRNKMVHGVRD